MPGRIFTVDIASAFCEHGTDEYVLEIDPEGGTTREFALFPDCPGLGSLAMSPDGKRLRVVAFHWGAILEFDSQGNWEVVIDGSDGIFPAAEPNGITYDRDGNFYVSNYYTLNAKVFRFPSNGGAPTILAYANNNGVSITAPGPISVGPSGDAYVADEDRLIRIGSDGLVEMFDTYDVTPFSDEIDAVLVDDFWNRFHLG